MDVFVARQPIFGIDEKVEAYELLYRSGLENCFPDVDGDQATARMIIDNFHSHDIESMTNGKIAFLNFTRNLLLSECACLLPREGIVVEILEDVEPDDEVIDACRELKRQGYVLALDDFVYRDEVRPLIDLADIIKIDFRATGPADRGELFRLGKPGVKFLAEKVETAEEARQALELGATYLQGYFFSKPIVLSRKGIPAIKLYYLRILREINRALFDFKRLEGIFKHDLSLSHKLLRLVNSAAFGCRNRIGSLRQALVLLGETNLRKWASLLALSQMAQDKPRELVISSLVRASLCELLGEAAGLKKRKEALFLMGMFSMIDAILDLPLPDALALLPLGEDVKASLMGEGCDLLAFLQLARGCERGEWSLVSSKAKELRIAESTVCDLYRKAVKSSDFVRSGDSDWSMSRPPAIEAASAANL